MYVLHARWLGAPSTDLIGRVAFWAEDSGRPVAPGARPGRRPRIQDHPYAVDHAELSAILGTFPAGAANDAQIVLGLPTRTGGARRSDPTRRSEPPDRGPQPSPELVRDDIPDEAGQPAFGSWRIPAMELTTDHTLTVLERAAGNALPDDTTALGASVQHLCQLADLASDLVRRGRLLPIVVADPPGAWWRPVLTGADAGWARMLAMTAPASLSAIGTDAGTTGWAALLDGLVDAAARARLGRARLTIGRAGSPAARAWLRALIGVDRRIAGVDATEVAVLADELADWEADALAGPVRACFRLAEPPPEDETWQIRLGLQDADDPSAVVDATAVWTSRGELAGLGRQIAAPQETFLTELGKAARLYPQLDDALRTARPAVLELDPAGAHHFLREAAPTLVTAGFGVQLPGWWTKPSSRLGLKLTASTPSQPGWCRVPRAQSVSTRSRSSATTSRSATTP